MSHNSRRAAVAVLAMFTLLAAGGAPVGAASDEIFISGSSTVEPITSLMAELYAEQNPDAVIRVDGPGTGDGFKIFCTGETDASDASRPIKDEEVADCEANGIEYTELPVAIDGLTVVVNKASNIRCLNFNDLYAIFGPESSGGEIDLKDASALANELGGSKAPTRGTLRKFTPGPESGTYDSFIEITYEKIMETRLEEAKLPSDKVGTNDEGQQEVIEPLISAGTFPNDNEIVKRVEGSKNAIGLFGFAYFQENRENLKAVAIENSETGKCVKPTVKTIQTGAYPISRTLYIYPNNVKVAENTALKAFMNFYMTKKNLTAGVKTAGYVSLSANQIRASIDAWKGATR